MTHKRPATTNNVTHWGYVAKRFLVNTRTYSMNLRALLSNYK